MSHPTVSLLGLGRMGAPIAGRLVRRGVRLTVWNRSPGPTHRLRCEGVTAVSVPADAAAPVTLTVLTDLAAVEAVLAGDNGLIAGWRRAGISHPVLVVHGTVSPVGVADLARRLSYQGIDVVDAPLSGGVAGARSGALSVMVGGAADPVARCWPILAIVGSTVRHLGPVGTGQTAKACNQVVVAATVTALAEAMLLADESGIDRGTLIDLLSGGLADSEVLRQKGDRWLTGDYQGGGSSSNQLKDLRFVTETADSHRLSLPLAATLLHVFERAVADGEGDLDHSGVELSLRRHADRRR